MQFQLKNLPTQTVTEVETETETETEVDTVTEVETETETETEFDTVTEVETEVETETETEFDTANYLLPLFLIIASSISHISFGIFSKMLNWPAPCNHSTPSITITSPLI